MLGDVIGDGAGIEEAVAVEALLEVDAVLRGGVAGEQVEGEGAEAEEVGGDGVASRVVEELGRLVGGGGLGREVGAVQGRRDVEAVAELKVPQADLGRLASGPGADEHGLGGETTVVDLAAVTVGEGEADLLDDRSPLREVELVST